MVVGPSRGRALGSVIVIAPWLVFDQCTIFHISNESLVTKFFDFSIKTGPMPHSVRTEIFSNGDIIFLQTSFVV